MEIIKKGKITDFTDLHVWKEAHQLVLLVYRYTDKFPKHEKFGLSNQMQRCVVSITSNIAEGFTRRTKNEKLQFYYISLGSLSELRNQLMISKDLDYIDNGTFMSLDRNAVKVRMLLNGLIKSSSEYKRL